MKPVISNPKGYHIHSPFAFHLVTRILFPQPDNTDSHERGKLFSENHDQNVNLLLVRLFKFMNPGRAIFPRDGFFEVEAFARSLGTIIENWAPDMPGHYHMLSGDFVILNETQIPALEIKPGAKNVVWFITGIQGSELREYFKNLKKDAQVSQTYELNSCGIVIFNPEFQKENFVIKGKNSY